MFIGIGHILNANLYLYNLAQTDELKKILYSWPLVDDLNRFVHFVRAQLVFDEGGIASIPLSIVVSRYLAQEILKNKKHSVQALVIAVTYMWMLYKTFHISCWFHCHIDHPYLEEHRDKKLFWNLLIISQ